MNKFNLHYNRQSIDEGDEIAVLKALRSDSLSQGKFQLELESSLAGKYGVHYVTAFSSATAALHATLYSLGVQRGDVVWTTPLTFVATANAARYCGAEINFIDIDYDTFNISVPLLEEKLVEANKNNKLPKVIISVDFAGVPVDLKEIHDLCSRYGIIHLEDASQAQGATYRSARIGGCKYSDAVVFSFHPVKSMTTGEGGVVLTNDHVLDERLRLFRSAGVVRSGGAGKEPWRAEMAVEGYNYKMNEMEAALGGSQLSKVDGFIRQRSELYSQYRKNLTGNFIKFQKIPDDRTSAHHLLPILMDFDEGEVSKYDYYSWMKEKGVNLYLHYLPLHKHEFYSKSGSFDNFPNAEKYYEQAFSYPLHTLLKASDIEYVCDLINEYFRNR